MNSVKEFLKFICDNHEIDAPRLIFADWLEERGDPRANLLREECDILMEFESWNHHEGRQKLIKKLIKFQIIGLAADSAESVLLNWEVLYTEDKRPHKSIEAAWNVV